MSAIEYEPVLGLEIHAELMTVSKMFCACPVIDPLTSDPNTAVCPVCTGLPGALPVVNQAALEMAIRVGLALNCSISEISWFARKNYFYPDLPKGYQISQAENPVCHDGHIDIELSEGRTKRIRIRRAHLEEDTAKLSHMDGGDKDYSLADYNRSSVPLLEIVTEPDFASVEEAVAYGTKVRTILRYLGVNTGDMEKGVLRFEANISVRPKGTTELNTRTEIKNLNSFTTLEAAATREIARQIEVIRTGGKIRQATLGWDDVAGDVYPMRRKEDAHDYRYFPEPDLPAFRIARPLVEKVRAGLPELQDAKVARFQSELGLSAYDAGVLAVDRPIAEYFELTLKAFGGSPKTIANWMIGEVFRLLKDRKLDIADVKTTPTQLAALVSLVEAKQVNANSAKEVLADIITTGEDPAAIIEKRGLKAVSDTGEITKIIADVLCANQPQVQQYLDGKETVFQWMLGQVMKATKGKAAPDVARKLLTEQLAALKK